MRRGILALLMILGMATGCSDKDRIPSGVLSRQKMEDVLWDMIQADQYSSFLTKDSAHIDLKEERLRLYQQVFLLHGVSREQFRKSYDYYMARPDLTQMLFDSLQSKGNRLRSEAYSRPSATPVVTPPAPDTAHKGAVYPTLIPVFGHPVLRPGHSAGDTGRSSSRPVHPGRDTGRSSRGPVHPTPK